MENTDLIRELGRRVKDGKSTWREAAEAFTKATGNEISSENFRGRYRRLDDTYVPEEKDNEERHLSSVTHNSDGTVELCKDFYFDPNEKKSPDDILNLFGYDPNEWELISWNIGKWEVAIKEEATNRQCTTIRAKIKPKLKKELTNEEYLAIATDVFSKSIKPCKFPKKTKTKTLDKNKMLELPGIELHLGKLAFENETGQEYNTEIAKERFNHIIEEIVQQQDIEQCDTCMICIGNDFFNSDTINNTTTRGTQQFNDVRFKQLFNIGLEMYAQMLNTLREKFNHVEVRLQQGNHDYMSSFYLYTALSCYFKNDDIVNFSENIKDVQVFEWGKCAVFYTHGDSNLKRLIKSIPAEFYETWGRTIYRELHLGHLHCEVVVDDNSGMVTRRVGSPTGTDAWHYQERFIGATQKYQTFVWDKERGLLNVKYITFNDSNHKVLKLVK